MRLRGSRVRPRRRKRRLMSLCWRFRNWKRREISTMLIKRAQAKNFKSLRLSSKKMRRLFWLTKRSSRQAKNTQHRTKSLERSWGRKLSVPRDWTKIIRRWLLNWLSKRPSMRSSIPFSRLLRTKKLLSTKKSKNCNKLWPNLQISNKRIKKWNKVSRILIRRLETSKKNKGSFRNRLLRRM